MFFCGRLLSGAYHKKQARAMSDALKTGRACDGSSGTRRAADFGVELGMKRNDDSLLSPNSQSIENLFYYYDSIFQSVYPALTVEGVSGAGRPYLRDMVVSRHAVPCRHVTACHPLRAPAGSASPLPLASCLQP